VDRLSSSPSRLVAPSNDDNDDDDTAGPHRSSTLSSPADDVTQADTQATPATANIENSTDQPSVSAAPAPADTVLGRRRRSDSDTGSAHGDSGTGDDSDHKRKRVAIPDMLANTDADPGVSRNGNGAAVQSKGLSESPARQLSHVGVTNGAPKLGAFTNGSSNTKASANNTTYAGLRRDDVTRMFMQGLKDFGYSEAAHSVSRESGLDLESTGVASFRTAILAGSWAEAEELLGAHGAGGNGLALAPGSDRNLMRFWLRQQKFLELLERRDTTGALMVLRNDLTPLYHDTPRLYSDKSRLRFLSSLLMCKTPQDVKAKASWDGAEGESRKLLLAELLKCVSPSHMMTDSRLVSVLQQVQQGWIDKCLYHTDPSPPSLLYDHTCDRQRFPTKVALELTGIGEVWQVQFSHDGSKLAACGGSRVVRIWETKTFSLIAALGGHDPKGVGNLSWSPDDSLLVTCCQEKYARLWNVKASARAGVGVCEGGAC
jgi:hypothetical protein